MDFIKDLKELEKLLKLCRKQGVVEVKLGSIEIKLGDVPMSDVQRSSSTLQNEVPTENPYSNFPDGILTPEQLMFYSSGGKPEDDPLNEANQQ